MERFIKRAPSKGTKVCAFTGYRPAKMPFGYNEDCPEALDFKRRLRDMILVLLLYGYRHMISGGAQGMDLMAAETVLDLKMEYPDLTLEMAIPFDGQADRWPREIRERWKRCLDQADIVTVMEHKYTKNCFFARNGYMVNNADLLLACYDGQDGGTKMTVEYAKSHGCPVCVVKPGMCA